MSAISTAASRALVLSSNLHVCCCAGGSAHGVMLLNSNGMDIIPNQRSLTYK
jgi:hypothetical protein